MRNVFLAKKRTTWRIFIIQQSFDTYGGEGSI